MATRDITLTPEWVQITDGTQEATVQVLGGIMYLRDSPDEPGATLQGHVIRDWVSISPPQKAWVRAPWGKVFIVVT